MTDKTEIELACELIRVLDGVPIHDADQALLRARSLLQKTQVVSANSPLLLAAKETAKTLQTD
jgi:hypothetical protein